MPARDDFRNAVFARDEYLCVWCKGDAVDAHHIIDRSEFPDGGYDVNNGVSLCSTCHRLAESTILTPALLRRAAGITRIVLPPAWDPTFEYDRIGNVVLSDGTRNPGPRFWEPKIQEELRKANLLRLFNYA